MDTFNINFVLFNSYFSLLKMNFVICVCFENLSMPPSTTYSGMVVSQGAKVSETVKNKGECMSFCVKSGILTSIIYDPDTKTCSCHSLPLSLLSMSSKPGAMAFGDEEPTSNLVITWIASVIGESSHFSSWVGSYSSTKMIGPADYYPFYGNTLKAWCPGTRNSDQWVELAISESIYITEIHIYEVFFAGGVESVSIRDTNSNWMAVWNTPGLQTITNSRIFSPDFIPPDFKSNAIRIDLDLGATNVWSEFDAVRVVGTRNRARL